MRLEGSLKVSGQARSMQKGILSTVAGISTDRSNPWHPNITQHVRWNDGYIDLSGVAGVFPPHAVQPVLHKSGEFERTYC